jgi:hypothetical protein
MIRRLTMLEILLSKHCIFATCFYAHFKYVKMANLAYVNSVELIEY